MKIFITGAGGQLGYDLKRCLSRTHQVVAATRQQLDITNAEQVNDAIQAAKPDVIIHAAAYTAVDQAEKDWETAYLVNGIGSRNIAVVSERVAAKLVYISTDYVFDGLKGSAYHEFDSTNPLSVYGRSKLAGEQFVQHLTRRSFIVRTSWLYGRKGRNFVTKILQLAMEGKELSVVSNEWGSPTYTVDLAKFIDSIISTDQYGTYHASNAGYCSRYELAKTIIRLGGYRNKIIPVPSSTIPLEAKRPINSSLDHLAIRLNKLPPIRNWKEGLCAFLINDLNVREVSHLHD